MSGETTTEAIGITMGDPAGAGPEAIASGLADLEPGTAGLILVGDDRLFESLVPEEGFDGFDLEISERMPSEPPARGTVRVWNPTDERFPAEKRGRGSEASGRLGLSYVEGAFRLWQEDRIGGIVTGPVSKQHISLGGDPFYGQTEWFAQQLGVREPVMGMTWNDWLVTVVTRHIPVKKIPLNLTSERIAHAAAETARGLTRFFGVEEPRVGVTGLNPHAGEGGMLGREEEEVIAPAVEQVSSDDFWVEGPLSAEHLITRDGFEKYDAVVAMYHDQGLVPLKARGFRECAALTFGLPLVRTSVSHGTAFDLAGSQEVSGTSLCRAVELARRMVSGEVSS